MFRRKHSSHDDKENVSAQQEAKVNELKIALGPLSGRTLQFCDESCIRRYLEARNWNVEKAKKMLEETLKWRSIYKPEDIRWHEVAGEGETGKVYRANFKDKEGRTVLVMRPGKQIVKYFMDPKTSQKVKFVYPKDAESLELMHKTFDVEILPVAFGGKNNVEYDHEEFSRLMAKDDIIATSMWDSTKKTSNSDFGNSASEVVPEPSSSVAPAG